MVKRLNVDISDDLFRKMKLNTVDRGITITDYIIEILEKDLKSSKWK